MYLIDPTRPNFVPRKDRDMVRGQRVADKARAAGADAMTRAMVHIEGSFGVACFINAFKRRAEIWIEAGPYSIRTRARFRNRAEMLGDCSLEYAICRVDRWYVEERRMFHAGGRPRLHLEILKEARLLLRWMRATGNEHEWPEVLEALTEPTPRAVMPGETSSISIHSSFRVLW